MQDIQVPPSTVALGPRGVGKAQAVARAKVGALTRKTVRRRRGARMEVRRRRKERRRDYMAKTKVSRY